MMPWWAMPSLAAVWLLTVGLTACGPSGRGGEAPASGPRDSYRVPLLDVPHQVLFDGPLLMVPGPRWSALAEGGDWSFRTFAELHFLVREPVAAPLVVRLEPRGDTAGYGFRLAWDGADLPADAVGRDGAVVTVEIPADALAPGRHALTLARVHDPQVPFAKVRHDNVFASLGYACGDQGATLLPAEIPRQRLIAEFLQHGVVGREQERRGGVLFIAPGRRELALPAPPAGSDGPLRVRFEPENFSPASARFRLAGPDGAEAAVEVAAGGRGTVELELAEPPAGPLALEVAGAADGVFLWGMPVVQPARGADLPPIVLITLDTTRRDALAPYGGRPEVTPVLAALAEQATVYEHAYSTAPWTLPSHASIFTGLYPSRHRAGVSEVQLLPGSTTLAGQLRRRGYLTAGFSSGELSSSRFGLALDFHHYRNPDRFETAGGELAGYLDAFLDGYGTLPLFLFVNYFDAHAVYRAPAEFEQRLGVAELGARLAEVPVWSRLVAGDMTAWRQAVEGEAEITPEVVEYLTAAYLAEVAFDDHLLGRLFDRLRQLGIFDRALIVVTADHGELLGEGGYVSHAARLDPELMEIPLIVKWPGQTAGERVSRLVSLVDLFPTVLAAAGVEPPPSDGVRLVRPGEEAPPAPHRFVLLEEHECLVHPLPRNMKVAQHFYGVQRPDFRQLVWDAGAECARRDPSSGAWEDASCAAERELVLRTIQADLALEELGGDGAPAEPMSEELREGLRALGYL